MMFFASGLCEESALYYRLLCFFSDSPYAFPFFSLQTSFLPFFLFYFFLALWRLSL